MRRARAMAVLAVVFVLAAIWAVWSLTGSVFAAEASGRTWCGGSPIVVLQRGDGYNGGELRADEAAFDARCAAAARRRLELSIVPDALVLATGAGMLGMRRRAERRPRALPITYSLPRS